MLEFTEHWNRKVAQSCLKKTTQIVDQIVEIVEPKSLNPLNPLKPLKPLKKFRCNANPLKGGTLLKN